jgi:ADP-ribose pyrophosphatase YjhB (NUDIX family)
MSASTGKNSHCSYCGAAFAAKKSWPRTCEVCGETSFANPVPVAVALVPVDGGLLAVRRAIEPHSGGIALPGGYINLGESWQQAAARELWEETGVEVEAGEFQIFEALSAPDGSLLVFGLAQPRKAADLPPFRSSAESSDRTVVDDPQALVFSLHAAAARRFFESAG